MMNAGGTGAKYGVRQEDRDAGFTLVELLVVLAIVTLIAGLVAPQVLGYLGKAKVNTTQAQMANVASALELYYLDVGSYPSQDAGLVALVAAPADAAGWNGPYLKTDAMVKDGWGKPFAYISSAEQGVSIVSYGRDAKQLGEGLDADLVHKVQ